MALFNVIVGIATLILMYLQWRAMLPSTATGAGMNWGLYWPLLVMGVLVVMSWVPLAASYILKRNDVTTRNVKDLTERWLKAWGYSVRIVKEDKESFGFDVTLQNGNHVSVYRQSKPDDLTADRFLTVTCAFQLHEAYAKRADALTHKQRRAISQLVSIEIARARLPITAGDVFRGTLIMARHLPISGLTEFALIVAVNDLNMGRILIGETVVSQIEWHEPMTPPSGSGTALPSPP